MFSFDTLLDQAKSLFSGEIAGQVEDLADPLQSLSDAGIDLEALSNIGPEQATAFLEQAGLDPSLLENASIEEIASRLTGADNAS